MIVNVYTILNSICAKKSVINGIDVKWNCFNSIDEWTQQKVSEIDKEHEWIQ